MLTNISGNFGWAVQLHFNFSCQGYSSFYLAHLEVEIYKTFQSILVELSNCAVSSQWSSTKAADCFRSPAPCPQKSPTSSATLLQVPISPQSLSHQAQLSTQISMSISRWRLQYRGRCNTACRFSLQHSSWHPLIGGGGLGPRFLRIWNIFRDGYFSSFF